MQTNRNVRLAILRALQEVDGPAGAERLTDHLVGEGVVLQPRTIRFHLLRLDREGLTRTVSRRMGRELTALGREELARGNVIEKVGFVRSKMDALTYRMSFRAGTGQGTIIANIAMIPSFYLERAMEYMKPVFARRLAMGGRLAIAGEGESLGGFKVPRDRVGLGTVCSVTVNGILLAEKIPVTSRFGGLLEICEGKPVRFVELMDYGGTTMDPLETFIQAGLTRVRDAARTGSGIIGASFREVPAVALDDIRGIQRAMEKQGLGGIMALGQPNRPLLDIPVSEGRAGMVVVGGLNPVAGLKEAGAQVEIHSLAGLCEASAFEAFQTLRDRYPA